MRPLALSAQANQLDSSRLCARCRIYAELACGRERRERHQRIMRHYDAPEIETVTSCDQC